MDVKEQIEHEIIKNVIKMGIMSNQSLNDYQKQQAIENVDRAAQQTDWLMEMLRNCGYLQ